MRRLSQTAVLLALTACMSPSGKTKRSPEVSAAESDRVRPTPPGPELADSQLSLAKADHEATQSSPPVSDRVESTPHLSSPAESLTPNKELDKAPIADSVPVDPNCQLVKGKDVLPVFLPTAQIYVRQAAKPCLSPSGEAGVLGSSKVIVAGLPCTQNSGRLSRLYESSISRPNAVKFPLPLNCLAIPEQDTPKKFLAAHLTPESLQKLVAFYPIQINYWEFQETPDQGFDDALTLQSEKGRDRFVKWWAKDADMIPVRVYGRESSMIPSGDVYEAQIHIVKRKGSQFQVQVDSIRVLEKPDIELVINRCKSKYSANACVAAMQ